MLEGLALGVVEGVGEEDGDGVGREAAVGEDMFAADDGVADDLEEFFVDLDLVFGRDEFVVGEAGDELGGVFGAELELRVQHALDEGGGVFGDLAEELEIGVGEFAAGAGGGCSRRKERPWAVSERCRRERCGGSLWDCQRAPGVA